MFIAVNLITFQEQIREAFIRLVFLVKCVNLQSLWLMLPYQVISQWVSGEPMMIRDKRSTGWKVLLYVWLTDPVMSLVFICLQVCFCSRLSLGSSVSGGRLLNIFQGRFPQDSLLPVSSCKSNSLSNSGWLGDRTSQVIGCQMVQSSPRPPITPMHLCHPSKPFLCMHLSLSMTDIDDGQWD